jgi:hypothetical protein
LQQILYPIFPMPVEEFPLNYLTQITPKIPSNKVNRLNSE